MQRMPEFRSLFVLGFTDCTRPYLEVEAKTSGMSDTLTEDVPGAEAESTHVQGQSKESHRVRLRLN